MISDYINEKLYHAIVNFDEDDEAFMKYMKWVAKLGPWFTKQRFNKKD
jgi:hypothetical protein